ncbi:hypothetical protein HK096_003909 [Nowakowskiella sp. JEL0078]|nr:hypothetical protein HK096_003909 [Nowakowskiella sp. JEL0078]
MLSKGEVQNWDLSLLGLIGWSTPVFTDKNLKKAIKDLVDIRNECIHSPGKLTDEERNSLVTKLQNLANRNVFPDVTSSAIESFVTSELAGEIDSSTLPKFSEDATRAAENFKAAGNELFKERNYIGAIESYTNGILTEGKVDHVVLSALFSNCANARNKINEFKLAGTDAKIAQEYCPESIKPIYHLAISYHHRRKFEKEKNALLRGLGLVHIKSDVAVKGDFKRQLDDCLVELEKQMRNEVSNLAYSPVTRTEGAFKRALQAQLGLDPQKDPYSMNTLGQLDEIKFLDSESKSIIRHIYHGQKLGREGVCEKAFTEFRAAAELGSAEGMFNVGVYYYKGLGVKQNIDKLVEWFRKASKVQINLKLPMFNIGISDAWHTLGVMKKDHMVFSGIYHMQEIYFDSVLRNYATKQCLISRNCTECYRTLMLPFIGGKQQESTDIWKLKRRLLGAKKLIKEGIGALKNSEHKKALILFAQAKSVPEAILIVEKKESLYIQIIADHYSIYETCSDEDRENLGILSLPQTSEPIQLASYYEEMHRRYPENITFMTALAAWNAVSDNFQKALELYKDVKKQLSKSKDVLNWEIFYFMGVCNKNLSFYNTAKENFNQFLADATSDGHRKVPEAYYQLGICCVEDLGPKILKMNKDERKNFLNKIREYRIKGDSASDALPNFLQEPSESLNRWRLCFLIDALAFRDTPMIESGEVAGGDAISGCRRHPDLRSRDPYLVNFWRKDYTFVAQLDSLLTTISSTQSLEYIPVTTSFDSDLLPITIDEMLSLMEDKVHSNNYVDCIIVSSPYFTGKSYQFIVEDSYREPIRVAVYNLETQRLSNLIPGRIIRLLKPYLRFAADQTIVVI